MKKIILSGVVLLSLSLSLFSCKNNNTESADIQETAQQVGDVMASVDEVGGTSGNIAFNSRSMQNSIEKTFERFAPGELNDSNKNRIANILQPKANAAACAGAGFAACNGSRQIIRTFGMCTVGAATFDGTVTATWAGGNATNCSLGTTTGTTITRVPAFNITGRRSATLAVTRTGTIGQQITWISGTGTGKIFSFTNDGINRKFTNASSTVLFNQTTTTTSPITITGTDRANRTLSGGSLRVSNLLTSVNCDYVPTAVTWTASCNCPTSGSWAGSCSDGKNTSLQITGCGTATFTEGGSTESVTLDRCAAI